MSGHSKWATIKRQKGANDQKRGQLFTKLSKAITIAVKQGGSITDPESNFKLRLAVDAARAANMPKENIERAISRAAGRDAGDIEEVVYEGFGPGGFSVVVEGLTDNRNRTNSEVKIVFDKNGGRLGGQGSVMYQFEQKGMIVVDIGTKSFEDVFQTALDANADDVEDAGGGEALIYTKPQAFSEVRDIVESVGLQIKEALLSFKPIVLSPIENVDDAKKALSFVEKLEEMDDVNRVFVNFDIPDSLMESLQ